MRIRGLAVLAFLFPGAALAAIDVPRKASCLLVVDGAELIRGTCLFTALDAAGSFQISGLNGQFFADVFVERPGIGSGYWNGEAYNTHAHSPLGRVYREDACWANKTASICAW